MSVEGTTPGPRAGAAASDDEAGEDEAGGGEAEVEGQAQRRGAPRGLGVKVAEAAAGDMDVAEALAASAEGAAGADLRPRPEGWETWSPNRRAKWRAVLRRTPRKRPGPKGGGAILMEPNIRHLDVTTPLEGYP